MLYLSLSVALLDRSHECFLCGSLADPASGCDYTDSPKAHTVFAVLWTSALDPINVITAHKPTRSEAGTGSQKFSACHSSFRSLCGSSCGAAFAS